MRNSFTPNLNTSIKQSFISKVFQKVRGEAIDPILAALIKAHCTMYLDPNKADGTSKGINTPLTSPLKDLIGSNDATLVNFDGTVTSGYDDLTLPNTSIKTFLKGDGGDDVCKISNAPTIDPIGDVDFAMCGVFRTPNVLKSGYYLSKNLSGSGGDLQFAILASTTGLTAYLAGVGYSVAIAGNLQSNTLYSYLVKYISGTVKILINGVLIVNTAATLTFVSKPNFTLFARSTNVEGTTFSLLLDYYTSPLVLFYNGATGLNETDIDNACALLKADYF